MDKEILIRRKDCPTSEINWEETKRFCEWQTTRGSDRIYRGEQKSIEIQKLKAENLYRSEMQVVAGYSTKDIALNGAFSATIPKLSFMGPGRAPTPEQRGVPIHTDSPENNAHIITTALLEMGACDVGFVRLEDETTRKLIYKQDSDPTHDIVFEDVEVGYETAQKRVIPQKAQWVIVYSVAMSHRGLAQAPSQLSRATTMNSYVKLYTIYNQLHEFIRGLGYHSYGAANFNGFGAFVGFAVLAGLGELSRMDILITPKNGPMVRLAALATDLPIEPTKPIDFGVMQYCKICKICAVNCPSKAISNDTDPTWEPKGVWSNRGHKAYFRDAMKCRDFFYKSGSNCGVCIAKCPFSQPDPELYAKFVSEIEMEIAGEKPMSQGSGMKREPQRWWGVR